MPGQEGIARAVKVMFARLATPGSNRPCRNTKKAETGKKHGEPKVHDSGNAGVLDGSFLKHMRTATEGYLTDAAGDEKGAGEYLRKISYLKFMVVNWDKCHGVRRVTSRPWAADALLAEVMDGFILSPGSPTCLCKNSADFRIWFQRLREELVEKYGTHIKSLSLAKHRFDSTQKPLGRTVLNFRAYMGMAIKIERVRKGTDEQKCMRIFLCWVTVKKCMILAMLADAGDEAVMLVRVFDEEQADASEIAHVVWHFIKHIKYLFVDAGCLSSGYTQFMLKQLCDPIVYTVGSTMHTLGDPKGVKDKVLVECLSHMNAWVSLAIDTLRAECPEFEILQSFNIFKVIGAEGRRRNWQADMDRVAERSISEHLERMAEVFQQDKNEVKREYHDLYDIAYNTFMCQRGLSSKEAWRLALEQVNKRWNKDHHSSGAIAKILARWVAWVISTSGLEQGFSAMDKVYGNRRQSMSRQKEQDILTLIVDKRDDEVDEVIEIATELWSKYYGPIRCRTGVRNINAGKGQKRKSQAGSEQDFIRKRRKTVGKAAASSTEISNEDLRLLTQPVWTDKHEKEASFQRRKRNARLQEAIQQGHLKDHADCTTEEWAVFKSDEARLQKGREQRRKAAAKNRASTFRKHAAPDFKNKSVFVEKRAQPALTEAIAKHGMNQLRHRLQADMICADTVSDLSLVSQWVLAMKGGTFVTTTALVKGQRFSGMVKFRRALQTKRMIWISTDFTDCHPELANIVLQAIALPCSNWKSLEGQVDDFFAESNRRRQNMGVIALVSGLEKTLDFFKAVKNAYDPEAFLEFISKFNGRVTGACGE